MMMMMMMMMTMMVIPENMQKISKDTLEESQQNLLSIALPIFGLSLHVHVHVFYWVDF